MIGRVYKITSEKAGLVYIGSTVRTLKDRYSRHYTSLRRWLAGKHHNGEAYKILECDDVKIELIEELEVADEDELRKREGYYQRIMECVNKRIAGRNKKMYAEEHREQKRIYDKERRKIKTTCECGSVHSYAHKSDHLKSKKHQDWFNRIGIQSGLVMG